MGRFTRGAAVLAAACMLFSGVGAAQAADATGSFGSGGSGTSQCVPGKSTIAQCFPDKALAQAIAGKLKGGAGRTGEVLTSGDVEKTHSLSIQYSEVSSVQGLQVFTNLTSLDLYFTKVSDVSPLAGLKNLTSLGLDSTKVSDVSPLAGLKNLTELYLGSTKVSDVSPLAGLKNLTSLDLYFTKVSDVSPLAGLKNLTSLGLGSTKVSDVSPLAGLKNLTELYLGSTKVSDVSPLASLTSLTYLNLYNLDSEVGVTVNADGSASMPAPRGLDGTAVAPSSTSPSGGVLDAAKGVVTWAKYDPSAVYSYDFSQDQHYGQNDVAEFSGHVSEPYYTVSFDSQGGSAVAAQKVQYGSKASQPASPTRSGYTFAGWWTAASGGSKYDFSKPVKADVRLYARWTKNAQPSKPSNPTAATQDMYRLYNPNSGEHFYTAAKAERDHLKSLGWHDEGTGWTAPIKSDTPVYRLYNPNAGDHHYTMNSAEKDMLVAAGWNFEGVGWYSADASDRQRAPLYRQYNPNAKAGSHNYTLNKAENDWLVHLGWHAEGLAWYAVHA